MKVSIFKKNIKPIKKHIQVFILSKKRKILQVLKLIRELKKKEAKSEKRKMKENLSTSILNLAFISSMFVSGLLFVALFLPLMIISSRANGLNSIDVLFFGHLIKILPNRGPFDLVHLLFKYHHWPTIFSFGIFYGVGVLVLPFLLLVVKMRGWIEVTIMSNGILLGYFSTYIIASSIFKETFLGINKLSQLSFAYVLVFYYLAFGLIEFFGRYGMKLKYDHLFMGVHGICSGWILSRGFHKVSAIFTGFIFLIMSFIAISLLELSIGRFLRWIFGTIPSSRIMPQSPLSIIKKVKLEDFWFPFIIFTLVFIGFPFVSFLILSSIF